jgi:hypothetical protein
MIPRWVILGLLLVSIYLTSYQYQRIPVRHYFFNPRLGLMVASLILAVLTIFWAASSRVSSMILMVCAVSSLGAAIQLRRRMPRRAPISVRL